MGKLRLAVEADRDLDSITDYSVRAWGESRAARYVADLEACCRSIVNRPLLGRSCERIHPGLRRIEQGKHVIFYMLQGHDVLVVRILHQSMVPERRIPFGGEESNSS
jgi:toxin ParE1/3/4